MRRLGLLVGFGENFRLVQDLGFRTDVDDFLCFLEVGRGGPFEGRGGIGLSSLFRLASLEPSLHRGDSSQRLRIELREHGVDQTVCPGPLVHCSASPRARADQKWFG